jgi:hypothetical protein
MHKDYKKPYKIGDKYNRLKIIRIFKEPLKSNPKRILTKVECVCDCGGTTSTMITSLRNGKTKSCGCYFLEKVTTHGMVKTIEYNTYDSIKSRCLNINSRRFKDYGGRGIKCEWNTFEEFYKDMGDRPKGLSIDRIDNNGNYSKENCRWATPKEQARNRKTNILVKYNGEIKCLSEWSEIKKININTLRNRHKKGWNIKKMLETPADKKYNGHRKRNSDVSELKAIGTAL